MYVRYFEEDLSWWICLDRYLSCSKLFGPFEDKKDADFSLTLHVKP